MHCGINIRYRPNSPFGGAPFKLWKTLELDWEYEDNAHVVRLSLQDRKIKNLDQYMYSKGFLLPRLTSDEIQIITADYPYQLPVEVHELYQRGNGCYPTELAEENSRSFKDYFYSPFNSDYGFEYLTLQEAMEAYRYKQEIETNSDIFPIASGVDRWTIGVKGSKEQKPSSELYSYYCDSPKNLTFQWPDLVSQMAAAIELTERKLNLNSNEDKAECISVLRKYGNTYFR